MWRRAASGRVRLCQSPFPTWSSLQTGMLVHLALSFWSCVPRCSFQSRLTPSCRPTPIQLHRDSSEIAVPIPSLFGNGHESGGTPFCSLANPQAPLDMAHIDLYVTESFINLLNSVVDTIEIPSARTQQKKKHNPENPVHIQSLTGFLRRKKFIFPESGSFGSSEFIAALVLSVSEFRSGLGKFFDEPLQSDHPLPKVPEPIRISKISLRMVRCPETMAPASAIVATMTPISSELMSPSSYGLTLAGPQLCRLSRPCWRGMGVAPSFDSVPL